MVVSRLANREFVAPLGDLLTLPALDPIGVLQDIFHRPPHSCTSLQAVFPDARHAGNVVNIAPQRQDVAYQLRILDAVFLRIASRPTISIPSLPFCL